MGVCCASNARRPPASRSASRCDLAGRLTALKAGQLTDQSLSYAVNPRIRGIEERTGDIFKTSYDYTGFGALKDKTLKKQEPAEAQAAKEAPKQELPKQDAMP